jgi:hypothetical protein
MLCGGCTAETAMKVGRSGGIVSTLRLGAPAGLSEEGGSS